MQECPQQLRGHCPVSQCCIQTKTLPHDVLQCREAGAHQHCESCCAARPERAETPAADVSLAFSPSEITGRTAHLFLSQPSVRLKQTLGGRRHSRGRTAEPALAACWPKVSPPWRWGPSLVSSEAPSASITLWLLVSLVISLRKGYICAPLWETHVSIATMAHRCPHPPAGTSTCRSLSRRLVATGSPPAMSRLPLLVLFICGEGLGKAAGKCVCRSLSGLQRAPTTSTSTAELGWRWPSGAPHHHAG